MVKKENQTHLCVTSSNTFLFVHKGLDGPRYTIKENNKAKYKYIYILLDSSIKIKKKKPRSTNNFYYIFIYISHV